MVKDVELNNKAASVIVKTRGAEVVKFALNGGPSVLWSGDKSIWNGCAPHLFPCICNFRNNAYVYRGKRYEMWGHGFIQYAAFQIVRLTSCSVELETCSTPETLRLYPFRFVFRVRHALEGRTLTTEYTVRNLERDPLYFKLGAHPGLSCAVQDGEKLSDYELELAGMRSCYRMAKRAPLLRCAPVSAGPGGDFLPLSRELFAGNICVFPDFCGSAALRRRRGGYRVSLAAHGFGHLGVWSPERGGDFVCLEPWAGTCEFEDEPEDIECKRSCLRLGPEEDYRCGYALLAEGK